MGTKIFISIIGVFLLLIGFFMFYRYIYIIRKGERYIGEICDISFYSSVKGGSNYSIVVKFFAQDKEIKTATLDIFTLTPFFEKWKLARLRKKYIGRPVHIYYTPTHPLHSLTKEFFWKHILYSIFLILMSGFLICAAILAE